MTQPTQNMGLQAAAMGQLRWVVRLLEKIVGEFGVGTEVGKDVLKALNTLSKHAPPGSGSPGVENSALQQVMMKAKQDQPQINLMNALRQGAGGSAGGSPPPPPAAAA